jgi:hypothetical protein
MRYIRNYNSSVFTPTVLLYQDGPTNPPYKPGLYIRRYCLCLFLLLPARLLFSG